MKNPIGPLKQNNVTITDPAAISEILKAQFESVFSTPNSPVDLDALMSDLGPRGLEDLTFNEDEIEASIVKIPKNSSAGLDEIPAILLRNCASQLKKPIFLLWRASLDAGKLPQCMKKSVVTPVHKGGQRCLPENYRPISLTSHICKLFERIVVHRLTKYLNEANLFNERQHGFRSGRSCLSQLLSHHQEILDALENNAAIDVVYLDFAKAFDRVDYGILLKKLKAIGVCGKLLAWLADFLTGRKQVVKVSKHLSTEGPVYSGVPQGSSLGPLLFLILMADIDSCVSSVRVSSFADDTRFLQRINELEDAVKMQEDLIGVFNWAEENNLKFNSCKFEMVSYSCHARDLNRMDEHEKLFPFPQYFDAEGNVIPCVPKVKDLGVFMSSNAKFLSQINESVRKGSRHAGWILRVFRTREPPAMLTLYRSMVLPHLEYCCPLWSPTKIGKVRQIEAVQRNFTSKITSVANLSYWERLKALDLYSLERRRERYLILYVFKIIQNVTPNFDSAKFEIKCTFSQRRGRICTIPPINNRATGNVKSMVEASFPVRGPRLFNSLPIELRNFNGSVDAFKSRLDKFLEQVPDKPCLPAYQQPASTNSIIEQLAVMRAAGIYHP